MRPWPLACTAFAANESNAPPPAELPKSLFYLTNLTTLSLHHNSLPVR